MSSAAVPFTLRVDGAEIFAEELSGRLVLSCVLSDDESILPTLAAYAAGRMLKEDATLAYGIVGSAADHPADGQLGNRVFLWQDVAVDAGASALRRLFESFLDSCDWWRMRVDALRGGDEAVANQDTMVILP